MPKMRRTSYAVAIPLAALALTAAPASAQVPGATAFGGGDLVDLPAGKDFPGQPGDTNVDVLTSEDGTKLLASASHIHACGDGVTREALGSGEVAVAPDGTFTFSDKRASGKGKDRFTSEMTVTGRFESPQRISGTVTSTSTADGKTCSGTANFVAVDPSAVSTTPAAAPPAAVLRGVTVGGKKSTPYDIVVRTAADGKSIVRANVTVAWRCNGKAGDEVFYEEGAKVAADGSFTIDNPWTTRYANGTVRGRVVIRGQFVEGGVVGTVRATSTFRGKNGKLRERCASGKRSFAAIVS